MNDNWKTPKWLMKFFKNCYDPCPSKAVFNGLEQENWDAGFGVFVNPPYSNPLPWVKKAIEQQKKGANIILLLRVDPSTEWYRMLIEANAHIAFFNERLKFSGSKNSPNFASMLVFLEGCNNSSKTVEGK